MERVINTAFLALFSLEDIRHKSIPFFAGIVYLIAGVILSAFRIGADIGSWGLQIVPGIIALMISLITRGNLGSGDAMVIFAIGLCLGIRGSALICIIGLVLSSLTAMVVFIIKRDKNYRLAFIPFLLCGAVAEIFIG